MAEAFSIQVHGFPALTARVKTLPEAARHWGKETAEKAASAGSRRMRNAAPASAPGMFDVPGGDRSRPRLKSRIGVTPGGATYHPGGAGGGGYWEQRFGVASAGIRPLWMDPAFIITVGTGERGKADAIHKRAFEFIRPGGGVMRFMHAGSKAFARRTRGQRPQDQWVREGQHAAGREVRRRMAEFDLLGAVR